LVFLRSISGSLAVEDIELVSGVVEMSARRGGAASRGVLFGESAVFHRPPMPDTDKGAVLQSAMA